MKNKTTLTLIAFGLFLIGFVGLIVNLIGLPFMLTDWLNLLFGNVVGFLFKLFLVMFGLGLAVFANSPEKEPYDEYFDGDKFD
ncbi:hypothetical protein PPO43_11245 [Saprospira sp. CCB-QB6]|uniref:hypothetical protein n=1 Tax=Saprospira sp. CCB-QB6 TaxID=3023936 RepID=UPI00234BED65|nr:hypothetical protein [Saprospira sp. CCB-QB6]WCL80542.1 hypothetical protein PPO43_11245 [Saprospira sp. CCB-QB6]